MTETVTSPQLFSALASLEARARERELFVDNEAVEMHWRLISQGYAIPDLSPEMSRALVLRVMSFDYATLTYLARHWNSPIWNLGCGFCTRAQRLALVRTHWYQFDLLEVLGARRKAQERWPCEANCEIDLASDAIEPMITGYARELHGQQPLVIAEGVLSYLEQAQVERLCRALRKQWGTCTLLGTAANARSALDPFFTQHGLEHRWNVESGYELARLFGLTIERIWTIAKLQQHLGVPAAALDAGFMFQASL